MGERENDLLNELLSKGYEEKLREARNATLCIIENNFRELAEKYNADFETFYKEFMKSLVELKSLDYKRRW